MKIFVLAGLAFATAVGLGALSLDDSYLVERSKIVKASPETVYGLLVNMEENQHWAPWRDLDPSMDVVLGEERRGVGASYSWESKKDRQGSYTIVRATEPVRIEATFDFGASGEAYGTWKLSPVAEGVEVSWKFTGEATGILGPYFALGIDGVVGPLFEGALARLATEAEAQAQAQAGEPEKL